jgi:hypothetical protein
LVFIVAFALHAALKLPAMRKGLALRRELAATVSGRERPLAAGSPGPRRERPLAAGSPGPRRERPLAASSPGAPTFSRRALLGTVGAGSLLLLTQGAAEAVGGVFRPLAFLAPRVRMGSGPNGFPVNRTAEQALVRAGDVDRSWRLRLVGARAANLSLAQLQAMPQHTYDLPIACVEGWSTTQRWTGVRLRDLALLAGVKGPATVLSVSLARDGGLFNQATLGHEQVADESSLLALAVNGVELSLDHGYPARVIGPALPGVHCTKWVTRMTFTPV